MFDPDEKIMCGVPSIGSAIILIIIFLLLFGHKCTGDKPVVEQPVIEQKEIIK